MKKWKIDTVHSEIKFKVKHLVVSNVTGQFKKFDGTIESSADDFDGAKVSFDLKSADFFDAANHPKLLFVSKEFKKKSDSEYELTGDMTIRGITKEITLNVIYNGSAKGMDGSDIAAFEIYGKLNRFDFGLHWNALTEAGGFAVGSEIKLEINTEMKQVHQLEKAA